MQSVRTVTGWLFKCKDKAFVIFKTLFNQVTDNAEQGINKYDSGRFPALDVVASNLVFEFWPVKQ